MLNKNGLVLPYTIFLFIIVLNIFVFVVLCSLNTINYYNDKNNYYQVFILEERGKRHIVEKITLNQIKHNESELLYYEEDFIYLTYEFDSINQYWKVNMRINHGDIDEYATIYYHLDTKEFTIEIR